jgi:DNA-binding response OmpR family regulator
MKEGRLEALRELSILCVEDEEGIRARLVKSLSYYFKAVYEAKEGEEGWEMYETFRPDVILSDIQMNGTSGIELAARIRENDKSTPIVMLTAYSKEEYLLELINLKIDQFILKPANSERLLEGILKALEGKIVGRIKIAAELFFSPNERKLYFEGREIALNRREKAFLLLLLQNGRKVTTYTHIEEVIWDGKMMSGEALKTFIKELRKKVTCDFLENVPQEGYRLIF